MKDMRRYRWLVGLALLHLILVGAGASSIGFTKLGLAGKVLDYYGTVTGANNGYAFFTPGVDGQLRAVFEVAEPSGKVISATLDTPSSHEASLRIGNIVDQFLEQDKDEDFLRRTLAASLAGRIFGNHPESHQVVVRLERLNPVSMEEYRRGDRAEWEEQYEAKFTYTPPTKNASLSR